MHAIRLIASLVVSALLHWLLGAYLSGLPAQPPRLRPSNVQVRVVAPPPPPEPEPEPPKPPEPAKVDEPKIAENLPPPKPSKFPPKVVKQATEKQPPKEAPPTERPATSGETQDEPVFGVHMDSTVEGGNGPSVPVGNTLQTKEAGPPTPPAKVKPLPAPVAAVEVTKMPTLRGKCEGKYTDAAREAGIEGTVVLDLVVDAEGNAQEVVVVKGIGHGLDESAVATLKKCKFAAGERNGQPVAVRIRAFRIRYFLGDEN